tara:strand:- start:182 stop:502 length:321 start_codon:yes stop_codon:yes gene_type:complete
MVFSFIFPVDFCGLLAIFYILQGTSSGQELVQQSQHAVVVEQDTWVRSDYSFRQTGCSYLPVVLAASVQVLVQVRHHLGLELDSTVGWDHMFHRLGEIADWVNWCH